MSSVPFHCPNFTKGETEASKGRESLRVTSQAQRAAFLLVLGRRGPDAMRHRTSGAASPLHTPTSSTSHDPRGPGPVTHPLGSPASALHRHSVPPDRRTGSVHRLGSARPARSRSAHSALLGSLRPPARLCSVPLGPVRLTRPHLAPPGPRAWPLSASRAPYLLTFAASGPRATCRVGPGARRLTSGCAAHG